MLPQLNILHLERREDRMQQLIRQMEWNKVPYILWEGIDDPNNVKQAITRGHKSIIQYAKDNNLPFINIAEDDLIWTDKNAYKYFNEQVPKDYDLFFGLLYHGTVDECNRVTSGMSGIMTLYRCHSRFYNQFLEQADGEHIDRGLGNFCHKFKFILIDQQTCYQSGGYSDNLKRRMTYEPYMEGKRFYGKEGQVFREGVWQAV